MKTALKVILALVVVIVIVAGVAIYRVDAIAKSAIERGGTYAMGVDTKVDGVSISLWGGTAGVDGLNIANPAGFPGPHLMHSGHLGLSLEPGTIREDTVVIREITIDGLDLHIRKKDGQYNVEVISENLKRFSKGEGGAPDAEPAPEPTEDKPAKQFVVQKMTIRNVTATVDGPLGEVKVTPPDIELENVTKDNVPLDQLIAQLFPAIMMNVVQALPGNLADLQGKLTSQLQDAAGAVGGKATELLQQSASEVTKRLEGVTGEATKALENVGGDVGRQLGETVNQPANNMGEGIGDAVGNLLGGGDSNDSN